MTLINAAIVMLILWALFGSIYFYKYAESDPLLRKYYEASLLHICAVLSMLLALGPLSFSRRARFRCFNETTAR